MDEVNLINFSSDPFFINLVLYGSSQNRLDIKKLKIIINNSFTNFIFYKKKILSLIIFLNDYIK